MLGAERGRENPAKGKARFLKGQSQGGGDGDNRPHVNVGRGKIKKGARMGTIEIRTKTGKIAPRSKI